MKAILLAAGFGTRLRPLTNLIPKCLVTINDKPLLEIWLEKLFRAGIDRVLINTHYLSNVVEDFVGQSEFKCKIDLFHEPVLLGTAGTLLACENFIDNEPFLLAHADNLSSFNVLDFINAHQNRPPHCNMTMMLFKTDDSKSSGIVELNELGVVVNFHEKSLSPPSNLANAAVYIMEADLIQSYKSSVPKVTDISTEIIPTNLGRIFTYLNSRYHRDIGNLESLRLANIEYDGLNDNS
jgi:mannose-1-phosphate guanylyltransferase